MSRDTIKSNKDQEIVVGWDPPCNSYFAQIYDLTKEEDEPGGIIYIGYLPGEVYEIEQLDDWLQQHAGIRLNAEQIKELFIDKDEGRTNHIRYSCAEGE